MTMRRFRLPAILACALLLAACAQPRRAGLPAPIAPMPAVALAVEAGDSVVVRHTRTQRIERVRLAGLDAPAGDQPHAALSAAALAERLHGVSLVVSATAREGDGSLRGWVCVTETPYFARWSYPACRSEDSINRELVEAGQAWARRSADGADTFRDAQAAAQARRAGLWAAEAPVPPAQWRALSAAKRSAILASAAPAGPPARVGPAAPALPVAGELSVDYSWLFGGAGDTADGDREPTMHSAWLTDLRGLVEELF